MPPRVVNDVLVVDRSPLARNMYQLLFSAVRRFRVRYADEYESLFKKSRRLRPDLLIVNSNSLTKPASVDFPVPAILISSKDRLDIKEAVGSHRGVVLIEKPFYPFDLISIAQRLIHRPPERRRGRKRKSGG